MTTNPNDYDPNELRGAEAGGADMFLGSGGNGDVSGAGGAAADEALRSKQYRELFLLQQTAGGTGPERPYLESLPRSYPAEMVVFEWLEYLVDRVGFRRCMDALRYYRSIEWITEPVERDLREYLTSFDDTGAAGELDRSDHLLSLVYVARLASMD